MYIVERGIIGCKVRAVITADPAWNCFPCGRSDQQSLLPVRLQGRVIVRGKVIGAELMLTHYPSDYVARALTYADLFALNRRDIEEITKK